MPRFKTDILIRNNMLKKMQDNKLAVSYEILSNEQYIYELKRKLFEEAMECLNASHIGKNDLKHEIADVLEVVEHLISACQFNENEIKKIKQTKKEKLGGFDKKIKTHFVEVDENNFSELEYYKQNAHKYPTID